MIYNNNNNNRIPSRREQFHTEIKRDEQRAHNRQHERRREPRELCSIPIRLPRACLATGAVV